MHNTEVKSEIVSHQQQQISHHVQTTGSPGRRMTNGDGVVAGGSRHHRDIVGTGMVVSSNECAGCGKRITDRFLLKALDLFWHEDCLKCGCCDCRLGEVGSTLYTKANLILCKRDYLRLFGNTGYCAACSKVIPAFEMVMRARSNVYHLECFACQQCNHRFCVGDRFYLCENKILCEYDYEERMVFANMACSPGSLALIRRQVSNFQQPGDENERQQQQQLFNGSHLHNIVDQYDQLDQQHLHQQHKHSIYIPKASASEPFNLGSYGEPRYSSNAQPPPSTQHCSQTGYITKQTYVKERSDPFVNETNVLVTSSPPTAERPKSSYSSDSDNLYASYTAERNNNTSEKLGVSKPICFHTPVITPTPMHLVRLPDDHPLNLSISSITTAAIVNHAMGSPDSGIVEGSCLDFHGKDAYK